MVMIKEDNIINISNINNEKNSDPEKKTFVMCPTPGCTYKLEGTWNDHFTGEYQNGLKMYKCPSCEKEFNINSYKINSVQIPNKDGLAVLYRYDTFEIVFKAPGYTRFVDTEGVAFIHVPIHILNIPNVKMVYFTDIDDEFTDKELIDAIREELRNAHK